MLSRRLPVCGSPNECRGQDISIGGAEGGGGTLSSTELEFALASFCRIRAGGCDLPILKMKEKNWLNLL